MIIVRALRASARPALALGAIVAAATGAYVSYARITPNARPAPPFAALQGQGQRLLISEFGQKADTLVAVDPADVSQRTEIARIDHAPEYGIFAALSPDRRAVAYTALPPDAPRPSPDAPAVAAIVDTNGDVTELADDVDLLVTPVWTPDSAAVVGRRTTTCDAACEDGATRGWTLLLLRRDGARADITTWHSAAPFPIGFAPDGATLYFTTIGPDGTDLYRVAPDGSDETKVAHLSDDVARDWRLSPDGTQIAFAAGESGHDPQVVARIVDLTTGDVRDAVADLAAGPPSTGVARGEFNPAWRPDGSLAIGAMNLDGGANAVAVDAGGTATGVTARADALDLPLSWSPDGAYLAVRSVEGRTPFDAGATHIDLVDASGARQRVSDSADVLVVGWLQ
jgi:Tol biopolymer transport system component